MTAEAPRAWTFPVRRLRRVTPAARAPYCTVIHIGLTHTSSPLDCSPRT